jgi:hypothetical protein
LVVSGHITPRPSGYALNKIKNLQYVELDYFTIKGCHEAQLEREVTSNHDTLGLTRLDSMDMFQPISSLKPLKNVRRDKDLSWEEMVVAKNKMLEHMADSGVWPDAHIKATMFLFVELENHPTQSQHLGNQIMVTYAVLQTDQDRAWPQGQNMPCAPTDHPLPNLIEGRSMKLPEGAEDTARGVKA